MRGCHVGQSGSGWWNLYLMMIEKKGKHFLRECKSDSSKSGDAVNNELAEQKLKGMLRVADIPAKPSFGPGEVQRIMGISDRTFWRLVSAFEIDPTTDQLLTPTCLDSYMLRRSRRVRYDELVAYLDRNQTWERVNAIDPRQMELF